jgi:hypothetical protein
MKRLILVLSVLISTLMVNAQSFELHQSYNDSKSAWGKTRLIAEYFWTSENTKWNVFSWNSFSESGINGLLYGEYKFASNLYAHAEVRMNNGNYAYKTITPQLGIAWLIPLQEGPDIYITPKYSYNDICETKHDIQVSINTSYETKSIYYEGYLDTNWINAMNIFTEQKGYFKLTNNFQLGACVVFNSSTNYKHGGQAHCQPYLSLRVAL